MIKNLLITLAILLAATTAYAADLTATVCESGCDYTSLDTAVSTEAQDLTDGGGDTMTITISGAWTAADSSKPDFNTTWVMDATNYLTVEATGLARTDGTYDATNYVTAQGSTYAHWSMHDHVRVDGITFRSARDGQTLVDLTQDDNVWITNSLFMSLQSPLESDGIFCSTTTNGVISNNVFYDMNRALTTNQYLGCNGTLVINNTVGTMDDYGFYSGYETVYRNNLVDTGAVDYYCWQPCSFDADSSYNISGDATSPNSDFQSFRPISFEDEPGDDYHLATTETRAVDEGWVQNQIYAADIDGDTRSDNTWDIGADEVNINTISGVGGLDSDTHLLVHFDEADGTGGTSVDDASDNDHTLTATGDAVTDDAEGRFDNSSVYDGTGDYFSVPDHADWDVIGTQGSNYVVDAWFKRNTSTGSKTIVAQMEDAWLNGWTFYVSASVTPAFAGRTTSETTLYVSCASAIASDDWYHISFVKVGNDKAIYLNGEQCTYDSDDTYTDVYAGSLYIGAAYSAVDYHNGWLDELRIQNSNYYGITDISDGSVEMDTTATPYSGVIDVATTAYSVAAAGSRRIIIISKFIPTGNGGYKREQWSQNFGWNGIKYN